MALSSEELKADVEKSAKRVMTHMNDDHADSVKAYARAYGGEPDAAAAVITGLTVDGFVLAVTMADGTVKDGVLVRYTTPLASAKDLHKVAVAMHFSAYKELGFAYRVRSGYYVVAAKMVGAVAKKAAMKRPLLSLALVAVPVVAIVASRRSHRR